MTKFKIMSEKNNFVFSMAGLVIWLLASLFFLYEFFLRTFLGSIAHQIIPDLHLNAETFSIIGSAYYIAYGLMQIPVGILADKFGVKLILTFAALVCAAATYYFAHADGFASAIISRLLMGFGSSFAFVCLLIIALTWFPEKYFGFFSGASQFIGTMGPLLAAGPLVEMLTKSHQNWRHMMDDIAVVGAILAVLIFLIVRNKKELQDQTSSQITLSNPSWMGFKKLMKNPQAWFIAFYSATVYVSISLLGAVWGTEYLQAQGLTQAHAAEVISLAWLGYAIGCPLVGAISDITKRRKPCLIFCAVLGLVATSCIVYLPVETLWSYGIMFASLGVAAAGQNVGFATIVEHVDKNNKATALGLNNGMIILFGAFIPPVVGLLIETFSTSEAPIFKPNDFAVGLSIMILLYAISAFIAIFRIRETCCQLQRNKPIFLKTNKWERKTIS